MSAPALDRANQPCEVPLIEQLRGIPEDYRTVRAIQWSDDGRETGHQFIPVGYMMHRAANEIEAKQAKIDALMLEYCPDEMTPAQLQNWASHQKPVPKDEEWPVAPTLPDPPTLPEIPK